MASSTHTTLPRRAVLAGAAVAALAVPVPGARANAADPVFAAKKRETVATWAKLAAIYDEMERRTKAMRPRPEMPEELLQPLRLPGKATPTAAHEEGWSEQTLAQIARTGLYLTAETTPTAIGATMRTEWKPVSTKTRKKAAELLKVRQAYDADREEWLEELHGIERASNDPLEHAITLAMDLMAYPVSTAAEVRDKMALAKEYDLFNLADEGDDSLRDWLLRDALAAAENGVSHA